MDTLTDKEHDSTVDYWPPWAKNSYVWKYNESFHFTVEWFASTNDAHFTIFSHIPPKPASCSRQFTQPSVRKIVVKFSRGKWSQWFSSGGSIKAAKHKFISFSSRPWWMITKADKDIAKRKHTYLFLWQRQLHLESESVWQRAILQCKVKCGSRIICMSALWFAHDCRFNYSGNALLRKLRVLHPTKFWIFFPYWQE